MDLTKKLKEKKKKKETNTEQTQYENSTHNEISSEI